MTPFIHGHLYKVSGLLELSNTLSGEVLSGAPALPERLSDFLVRCSQTYAELGQKEAESRLLELRLDLHAAGLASARASGAAEGQGPRRRERERAASLAAVKVSAELLRSDVQQQRQKLASARAMVEGIVLAALQKKIVPPTSAKRAYDAPFAEALWPRLVKDEDLRLACQRVAMSTSLYDIRLLVLDVLTDMHSGTGT